MFIILMIILLIGGISLLLSYKWLKTLTLKQFKYCVAAFIGNVSLALFVAFCYSREISEYFYNSAAIVSEVRVFLILAFAVSIAFTACTFLSIKDQR